MRRLALLAPWALGLILLLTSAPSADDPIEALRQAEREANANLAQAYGDLAKAQDEFESPLVPPLPKPGELVRPKPPEIDKAETAVREAESTAQQAAEARRAAEAKSIDSAKAATEARERSERAADRAKVAADRSPFLPGSSVDERVGEALRQFDAVEKRKDFKMALEREAELLDNDADRLEADAKTPGASAETKAAATRAREAADRAAARLRDEFPPLFPPRRAKPTHETIPPGTEQPPHIDPFPFIPGFPTPGDPTALGTVGPPEAGSQPVSADLTVLVDNRPRILICIPPSADVAKVATALGLAEHDVVAQLPTGTVIAAYGDPQTIEAEAKAKRIPLCFVEIDYCVIKTPLTAFRGHEHRAHPGGLHAHDAPDPPWDWGVTPPVPVVSWGGGLR